MPTRPGSSWSSRSVPLSLLLAILAVVPAVAAPPPNDDKSAATTIRSLPFADALDATEATTTFDDQRIACYSAPAGQGTSVWYGITATVPMRIVADTFGSDYNTTLAVGCVSDPLGNLSFEACNDDAAGTSQSQVRFLAPAGTACFIKVESLAGGPGGNLSLHVDADLPPPEMADLLFGQRNFVLDTQCNSLGRDARSLCRPNGIALDAAGNLYVGDTNNSRVLIYRDPLTTDRVADVVIGQPDFTTGGPNTGGRSAGSLAGPAGIALDISGNLYVADRGNNRVLVYFDPLNTDAVADRVLGQPDFVTSTSACAAGGSPSASTLCIPQDVAVDFAGNVYVSEFIANRALAFFDPLGTDMIADLVFGQPDFTTITFNTGGLSAASLSVPTGIGLDGAGNLYLSDTGNDRVLVYLSPLATDAVADLVLGQVDFSSQGDDGRILLPDGTQACGTPGATSLCDVRRLTVDAGGRLFVADSGLSVSPVNLGTASSRVLRYDDPLGTDAAADHVFGQESLTTAGCNDPGSENLTSAFDLCQPQDVAIDSAGNVYIADTSNNRVLAFRVDTTDFDGIADVLDACPDDPRNDSDLDALCANVDNCPGATNPGQADFDGDALGDACDACANDPENDSDGDGSCGDVDACPSVTPTLGLDADGNGCTDTLAGLRAIVSGLSIRPRVKNGLLGKLDEAQKALDRSDTQVAIAKLRDFIDQVEGARRGTIGASDAALMVAYANNLIALIEAVGTVSGS